MKWVLITLAVLVALAVILFVAGMMMPREHVATSRITLKAPPDSVFAVLRDYGSFPSWHRAITASVRVPTASGERWKQSMGRDSMELDVIEALAPSRLAIRIVSDETSAWGGTWTYALESASGGGTVVRVTEHGWINPPPFRVIMSVVGAHRTMDALLASLGARFGETVAPEHVTSQ